MIQEIVVTQVWSQNGEETKFAPILVPATTWNLPGIEPYTVGHILLNN